MGGIERIEFKILPDGRVEERVFGVKGEECLKITESIHEKLGEVVATNPTEEMVEEKVVNSNDNNIINQQYSEW